jgi:hypothetical protein
MEVATKQVNEHLGTTLPSGKLVKTRIPIKIQEIARALTMYWIV